MSLVAIQEQRINNQGSVVMRLGRASTHLWIARPSSDKLHCPRPTVVNADFQEEEAKTRQIDIRLI